MRSRCACPLLVALGLAIVVSGNGTGDVDGQAKPQISGREVHSTRPAAGLGHCVHITGLRELKISSHCFDLKTPTGCKNAYAQRDPTTVLRCHWDQTSEACHGFEEDVCESADREEDLTFFEQWDVQDSLWLGKEWFANGVQDWRIANGRVECISNVAMTAGRTANLLTHRVPGGSTAFSMEVVIGPVDNSGTVAIPGAPFAAPVAGLLIGIGDKETDYRQSALVQMTPGPGGGILVGVDAEGELSIRDFTPEMGPNNLWHACQPHGHGYQFNQLPALASCSGELGARPWPVHLKVSMENGGLLKAWARGQDGSLARCSGAVDRTRVAGGISLFSGSGPVNSSMGFAFDDLRLTGTDEFPERAFGPVLGVLYTVATYGDGPDGLSGNNVRELRMTVQHPVFGDNFMAPIFRLAVEGRRPITGTFHSDDNTWTTRFIMRDPPMNEMVRYKILSELGEVLYFGKIRKEKSPGDPAVVASLSCNKNAYGRIRWNKDGLWFPFQDVVDATKAHDPDLLYFSGDQVYNGDITPADLRSEHYAMLDYHYKWQRFLWAFGHLTKDHPTITIPDDHDLWQGNIWGEGGRSNVSVWNSGGFYFGPQFVNVVMGTQASHLPPTRVSARIGDGEGIITYTTSFRYSGLDLVVLGDRMWKTGPFNETKDPQLLGREQEDFLQRWAVSKQPDAWTKVALSQTPWSSIMTANMHTIPTERDYPPNMEPTATKDSNGYPAEGRTRAVRLLAQAGALHLTGDQHLGIVAQYGDKEWRDGTVVFSSPAVASAFPRFWFPNRQGSNAWPEAKRYMGDYQDGFGNKFTVLAVSNPVSEDIARAKAPQELAEKSPGYGIIRFLPQGAAALNQYGDALYTIQRRAGRSTGPTVILENWPNWADPCDPYQMYGDWPVVMDASARPQNMTRNLKLTGWKEHWRPRCLRMTNRAGADVEAGASGQSQMVSSHPHQSKPTRPQMASSGAHHTTQYGSMMLPNPPGKAKESSRQEIRRGDVRETEIAEQITGGLR